METAGSVLTVIGFASGYSKILFSCSVSFLDLRVQNKLYKHIKEGQEKADSPLHHRGEIIKIEMLTNPQWLKSILSDNNSYTRFFFLGSFIQDSSFLSFSTFE